MQSNNILRTKLPYIALLICLSFQACESFDAHESGVFDDQTIVDEDFPLEAIDFSAQNTTAGKMYFVRQGHSGQGSRLRNLSDVNSRCYRAGDEIRFYGGASFQGQLKIRTCADTGPGSIKVSVFGVSKRANLIGASTLRKHRLKWKRASNIKSFNGKTIEHLQGKNVYQAGPFPENVKQFFYNSSTMDIARVPNKGNGFANQVVYEKIDRLHDNCGSGTCMGDDDSIGIGLLKKYGLNKNDVKVVVRDTPWTFEKLNVKWVSPNVSSISYDRLKEIKNRGKANALVKPGSGYFLMNDVAFIDKAKEWYFDNRSKILYFFAPNGEVPTDINTRVSFSASEHLVDVDFQNRNVDLKFYSINLKQSAGTGLRFIRGRNLDAKYFSVRDTRSAVVAHTLSGNAVISYASISNSVGTAVASYNVAGNLRVEKNYISNAGLVEHQSIIGQSLNGISMWNIQNATVRENTINNSGYSAVSIGRIYANLKVTKNKIHGYCLLLNDCGGIYVNAKAAEMQKPANREISYNNLGYPLGQIKGQPPGLDKRIASGVYLDFWGSYFDILHNTIVSRSSAGGINIHGGDHNNIQHNKVNARYGVGLSLTRLRINGENPWTMLSNNVDNNQFIAETATGYAVRFQDIPTKDPESLEQTFGPNNKLSNTAAPGNLKLFVK